MSDFMRSIVNGILEKEESPQTVKSSLNYHTQTPEGTDSYGTPVLLKNIKRPNYQKDRMKQRLSPITDGNNDFSKKMVNGQAPSPQVDMSKSFAENSLSSLQRLSLFQIKGAEYTRTSANGKAGSAQWIGKTRDRSVVWFFPQLHDSLSTFLHLSGKKTGPMGIIASERFSPGQLFLIDEVMKEAPHLAYNVEGVRTEEYPFVFQLTGSNADELQKVLKEIYLRLNRRTVQGMDSYFTATPTRFLVQNLKLDNQEPVAVLDGVTTLHSVGLLDRLFKQTSPSRFRFRIESEYLLLQGEQEIIKSVITMLKQEADRLFTD